MHPNRHGYGLHGPEYHSCPNCGTDCVSETITSPVAGRKRRRCPECCPWWRVSVLLPLTALGMWVVAMVFWAATTAPIGPTAPPIRNTVVAAVLFVFGVAVFYIAGPKHSE